MKWFKMSLCFAVLFGGLYSPNSIAKQKGLLSVTMKRLKEVRYEVGWLMRAKVYTNNVDRFHACMSRVDHPLPLQMSAAKAFRRVHWLKKEHETLTSCEKDECKYRFPPATRLAINKAKTLAEKKQVYFRSLKKLTWNLGKAKKSKRVSLKQVKDEPCARHPYIRRLLHGKLHSSSSVFWRKMSDDKRIRPTIQTFHVMKWRVGQTRCIGRTLLFADHYYYDHLELLQLTPSPKGHTDIRVFVRSNFDFLDRWYSFLMKGKLRRAVRKQSIKYVKTWTGLCQK